MTKRETMREVWSRLAVRERRLVVLALVVITLGLLWGLAVAPALGILKSAPPRLQQLDLQLQRMQGLAAQARELQSRPAMRRADALRALESLLHQRLGEQAQISVAGESVTVTLSAVAPQLLSQWLSQVRLSSRVSVQQARLTRSAGGWNGSIVLQLPPE